MLQRFFQYVGVSLGRDVGERGLSRVGVVMALRLLPPWLVALLLAGAVFELDGLVRFLAVAGLLPLAMAAWGFVLVRVGVAHVTHQR